MRSSQWRETEERREGVLSNERGKKTEKKRAGEKEGGREGGKEVVCREEARKNSHCLYYSQVKSWNMMVSFFIFLHPSPSLNMLSSSSLVSVFI